MGRIKMSEPKQHDDPLDELLNHWGTRAPGQLPEGLSRQVMRRLESHTNRDRVTVQLVTCSLIVCLIAVTWWYGSANHDLARATSDNRRSASTTAESASENAMVIELALDKAFQTLSSIQTELELADLAAKVSNLDAQLQELQLRQIDGQRMIRQAISKEKAIQNWVLAQQTTR